MAMKAKTLQAPALEQPRERRPFARLEPTEAGCSMPPSAQRSLALLDEQLGDWVPQLASALVRFSLRATRGVRYATPPSVSVINRRRRAAGLWLRSILAGYTDGVTCQMVASTWLPQLTASGPEIYRGEEVGLRCIEFVRGSIHGMLLGEASDNLVPEARAMHVLDMVLAAHLDAFTTAVERSRRVYAENTV